MKKEIGKKKVVSQQVLTMVLRMDLARSTYLFFVSVGIIGTPATLSNTNGDLNFQNIRWTVHEITQDTIPFRPLGQIQCRGTMK